VNSQDHATFVVSDDGICMGGCIVQQFVQAFAVVSVAFDCAAARDPRVGSMVQLMAWA